MAPKTSNHKSVVQACIRRDDTSATIVTEKMSVLLSEILVVRHCLYIKTDVCLGTSTNIRIYYCDAFCKLFSLQSFIILSNVK